MSEIELRNVFVQSCRKCAYQYDFLLPDGKTVTVLCGQPRGVVYKAVSYLWENTQPLHLTCRKCSVVKSVPMRDVTKLWNILEFVRGGSKIWLDALSIDQSDPNDLAAQIAVMGNIYRDAEVVSVMLPAEDKEAFERLKTLTITADEIVKRGAEFGLALPAAIQGQGPDTPSSSSSTLDQLAQDYNKLICSWEENTGNWNYWSRAWTFQEWTMAAEIEITWEGIPNHGGLQNIKNVNISASSIIGHWRVKNGQKPDQGTKPIYLAEVAIRAEVSSDLNFVRMYFPFQEFLVADEVEDSVELRLRTTLTPMHSISSGTSVEITKKDRKEPNLRRLLGLALSAMSISERKARFEADLVHCWASMCNIQYDYNKDDHLSLALQKVTAALRKAGIQIFNFHATCQGGETDLTFMRYAAAVKHRNLISRAYMFGAPVFVGRVDTITHFRHCLEQLGEPAILPRSYDITLQAVGKVSIQTPIPCIDRDLVLSSFKNLVSGTADGQEVLDVNEELQKLLEEISSAAPKQLEKHILLPISISCQESGMSWDFDAWTICPPHVDTSKLFVARESLNGTLVLAVPLSADDAQIVAYLNMTHQRHGTYLIKTDKDAVADIVFRRPDPFLVEALLSSDFSSGPKPVDPAMMAMMGVPGMGLMDVLDEARNVQLTLGAERFRAA
ncbi:hypothetical protein EG329_012627 [Mollisiaceae sp. DMI_Dod_QoI]|nr:hypothetical protein EG329_012627 [Helotiales sp. DMI_Dod_QoI]